MNARPILLALTLVPACALAFRIRGGGLVDLHSTTASRAVWAIVPAALAALATADWRLLGLAPLLFAGAVLPWWQTIDLGRNEGAKARDVAVMTARGLAWVAPALPLLFWRLGNSAVAFAIAGLSCAACYEAAWRTPSRIAGLARGPELGEVYFGAALGAGLAFSVAV